MKTLSVGKYRGMQQCATSSGALVVLALDHRNNLRNALNPHDPGSVSDADLTAFKQEVVAALAPAASAVLLDPEVGAAQCVASGALPGQTGLVVALEATGYTGDPAARQSSILPGWSAGKARRMGASAAKLLVYYHPDAPTAAQIEDLVRKTAQDCAANDLALFVEPLSYSPHPQGKRLPPQERRRVVLETARRLTVPGVDVLKAEFPVDIEAEPERERWQDACAQLSQASAIPWVLLSASVPFDVYLRQVEVACRAGASGVAVGRAVWQEAPRLQGEERQRFLEETARPRLAKLTALCDALARPWSDFYTAPQLAADWYRDYA